jgi:site-specific DNA-methyltransferase (adenine-specific)
MNIAVPEAYCVESEAMADNKLYYGDNLTVLKDYVRDESVDLVYLDPPFNSRQDYNLSCIASARFTRGVGAREGRDWGFHYSRASDQTNDERSGGSGVL